jgi:predicted molibdopterin-dependent oxidoreductase YjgC
MAGESVCRTSVTGEPRGPLCGMGICFECRVGVDGRLHVKACQTMVRDGMEIRTE